MQPSAPLSRPLAIAALTLLAILCLISIGESLKVIASSPIVVGRHDDEGNTAVKRSWESEQGPFSPPRPGDVDELVHEVDEVDNSTSASGVVDSAPGSDSGDDENFGLPGLPIPNPIATGISVVGCWLNGCSSNAPAPGIPTPPPVAAPTGDLGGGLFPSVLSILAGPPGVTPAPGSSVGDTPLGGLLSALSEAAPSPNPPVPGITAPPAAPTGSGGLLSGLGVLDGVASALNDVLGSPDDSIGGGSSGGSGLLGQLSANILDPIASIAADPASILANPGDAISNLQSQVSAVLDSLPSAVAAGIQIASNVGGDLADALNATTDVLDSIPDVAGGVAGQVGSLLNAAPEIATGIPAAALDAVNQVGSILSGVPGLGDDVAGILGGLKDDLSAAVASAAPEVSVLAAVVNSQVVAVLPAALQPLVSGALSSLATAPPTEALPPGLTSTPSPDLASMLSSLSSSITSASPAAVATETTAANSIASSALSGLSSLMSQITQLSLTAVTTPPPAPASATPELSSASALPAVAETTIFYVQTITALVTSTWVQISTVTQCPSAFASYTLTPTSLGVSPSGTGASPFGSGGSPSGSGGSPSGSGGSPGDGSGTGPCPGQGYTCDSCSDGWFCPPLQTPALPAPCGYGWPCYHCAGGWFCVPWPQDVGAGIQAYPTPSPGIKIPSLYPDTNGYKYVGCYQDSPDRALRDAQLLTIADGMTSGQCIDFCSAQGFTIAGTEYSTQCYCGYKVLDSMAMESSQCNMSCAGDPTNNTMCGGSWALSIWSVNGSIQEGQSPEKQITLATTAGWQQTGSVRPSKAVVTTAIVAWSPPAPSADTAGASPVPTSTGMSVLESAILAAVASEAGGMALIDSASASGIIESVSIILNMGMSSIASVLSLTAPASHTPFISGPTNLPLGPGPVVPSTTIPTDVTAYLAGTASISLPTPLSVRSDPVGDDTAAGALGASDRGAFVDMTSNAAEGEGTYVLPTLSGAGKGRRASRRRALLA